MPLVIHRARPARVTWTPYLISYKNSIPNNKSCITFQRGISGDETLEKRDAVLL